MVVVLALVTGAMVLRGRPGSGRLDLLATANEAAARFRHARTAAISGAVETTVLIDTDRRIVGAPKPLAPIEIAPDIDMLAVVSDAERRSPSIAGIRFFPNGSATGGTLRLQRGAQAFEVRVNWFTGRVSVNADP